MKKTYIIMMVCAALLVSSCNRFNIFGPEEEGISFALAEGSAPLAAGEEVGVFIGTPLGVTNAQATFDGDRIVPVSKLKWGSDQKDSSLIMVYAPYTEALSDKGIVNLPVEPDFRMAKFKSAPKCANPIPVTLSHCAARIVLYLDSKNVGSIDSVALSAAYNTIRVIGATGTVAPGGDQVRLPMQKVAEKGTVSAWTALIAPQKADFSVEIKTGERRLESKINEATEFKSGVQYQNSRIICPGITDKMHRTMFQETAWAEDDALDWNYIDDSAKAGTVSSICALASAAGTDFTFNVKDVIVTYMGGDVAHLEDETAAIRLTVPKHGLFRSNTLDGELSGTVAMVDGMPTITAVVTEYASIISGGELPKLEVTLSEIISSFDACIARRTYISGIEFMEALTRDNPVAKIKQEDLETGDESYAFVYSAGSYPVEISAKKYGAIECFPGKYNGRNVLFLYNDALFFEMSRPQRPIESTPFTEQCTVPGVYTVDSSSAQPLYTYQSLRDQLVTVYKSSYSGFRIQSLTEGKFLSVSIPAREFVVGEYYDATIVTFGLEGFRNTSCQLQAVMAEEGKVWLSGEGFGIIFKAE